MLPRARRPDRPALRERRFEEVQVAAPGPALTGCWRPSLGQVRDRAARTELVPGRRQRPGTTGSSTLNISGNYHHPGVSSNPTRVDNQALSHSGALDLVMGDFTSAGGLARQQIFMLNLATSPASVTGRTSPQTAARARPRRRTRTTGTRTRARATSRSRGDHPERCADMCAYIRAASRSPYDSTSYLGTTSCRANGWPGAPAPRTGLCDAAAAFPATQGQVLSQWINHTGCDSLHATAADADPQYDLAVGRSRAATAAWLTDSDGPPGTGSGFRHLLGPYMVCARSSGAVGDLDKQLIRPEDRARGLSCAAWGNREAKPGAGRVDGMGVAMRACAWSITSRAASTGAQSGST